MEEIARGRPRQNAVQEIRRPTCRVEDAKRHSQGRPERPLRLQSRQRARLRKAPSRGGRSAVFKTAWAGRQCGVSHKSRTQEKPEGSGRMAAPLRLSRDAGKEWRAQGERGKGESPQRGRRFFNFLQQNGISSMRELHKKVSARTCQTRAWGSEALGCRRSKRGDGLRRAQRQREGRHRHGGAWEGRELQKPG